MKVPRWARQGLAVRVVAVVMEAVVVGGCFLVKGMAPSWIAVNVSALLIGVGVPVGLVPFLGSPGEARADER